MEVAEGVHSHRALRLLHPPSYSILIVILEKEENNEVLAVSSIQLILPPSGKSLKKKKKNLNEATVISRNLTISKVQ